MAKVKNSWIDCVCNIWGNRRPYKKEVAACALSIGKRKQIT